MPEPWEFFKTIEDMEELYSGPMEELERDEAKIQDALVLAIWSFTAHVYNDIEQASDREFAKRFQLDSLAKAPISPSLKVRLSQWVVSTHSNLIRKQ